MKRGDKASLLIAGKEYPARILWTFWIFACVKLVGFRSGAIVMKRDLVELK
jgi:hypothetical protein